MLHLLTLLPLDDPTPVTQDDLTKAIATASGPGHTAWMLASSALVLLMTPALAFFYGGLTRAKTTLNMMAMSFMSIGIVSVLWVFFGFSMAFSYKGPKGDSLVGNLDLHWLEGVGLDKIGGYAVGVPDLVFVAFQLMFAIITVALISGSIADRTKFGSWCVFTVIWMTVVYFPVAHWVFFFGGPVGDDGKTGRGAAALYGAHTGGWITNRLGALDFAGGTAVHINAGAAGLALCLVLGKRKGWPKQAMKPHNVPFVLLGSGLLWFGWFGFNAGSALQANGLAGVAFINTQVATATAMLGWVIVEWIRDGKPTLVGFASGAVAGLVAITPSCGSVNPMGAIAVGFLAGAVCAVAIGLKYKLGFDDSLDVVGVHLVGGILGTLSIGFFATPKITSFYGVDPQYGHYVKGIFYGGDATQLGRQALAAGAVLIYSFVATYIIGMLIHKTIGLRITDAAEESGIDLAEHNESAYEIPASVAH